MRYVFKIVIKINLEKGHFKKTLKYNITMYKCLECKLNVCIISHWTVVMCALTLCKHILPTETNQMHLK